MPFQPDVGGLSSGPTTTTTTPVTPHTKRGRGRPPGTGRKQQQQQQVSGPVGKKSRKVKKEALLDSSTVVTGMDDHIWKEFPKVLLEDVIARLPIDAFYWFRLVCQEWNSLLESHRFLQHWEEVALPQNKPWLYSITDGHAGREDSEAMYNPCTKKWHSYFAHAQSRNLVASIGRLVCFLDTIKKCFIVGNPITQTWKELPHSTNSRVNLWTTSFGMIMHNSASSRGYKIVTVDSWGGYEVHDSVMKSSTTGTIPANIKLMNSNSPVGRHASPATMDTTVYFLISNPDGILSYDAVNGDWEQFHIPAPLDSEDLALAECGGRILLTGLVRDKDEGTICVCVWELQRTNLAWTEVDRMPKSWCSDSGCKEAHLMCVGNKGLLMMVLQKTMMNRIFTYDVVNRKWSKIPRFILPGLSRRLLYTNYATTFFPSLSAAP